VDIALTLSTYLNPCANPQLMAALPVVGVVRALGKKYRCYK
jgi:hypothetical protein